MLSTTIWPLLVVLSFVTIVLGSASMTIVIWPVAALAGCAAGLGASAGFAATAGAVVGAGAVVAAGAAGFGASAGFGRLRLGFAGSAGFVAGAGRCTGAEEADACQTNHACFEERTSREPGRRCHAVLPNATAAIVDDGPHHYSSSLHAHRGNPLLSRRASDRPDSRART